MAARGMMGVETYVSAAISCLFVTWFLSVVFLFMRFVFEKRSRDWSTGAGPLVSLLIGALFVAGLSIGTAVLHFNLSGYQSRDETSPWMVANWYWATIDISQQKTYFEQLPLFVLFAVQMVAVILIATVVASRELLQRPIPVPSRVALELQIRKQSSLAQGESIDEIFGELKRDDSSAE